MAGTKRSKIKKNDQVAIIAGRDKGRRGRVIEVIPGKGKIKVEGAGMIKRHQKANPHGRLFLPTQYDPEPERLRLGASCNILQLARRRRTVCERRARGVLER